jgi:membrane protease YdiL (CAAX protease family)
MQWDIWLLFFVLVVLLPWRGHARLRKLLATPRMSSVERLSLYYSTMAFQWVLAAIVAWRAWARHYGAAELGLLIRNPAKIAAGSAIGTVLFVAFQWMNLRRIGRLKCETRGFLQTLADKILPRTWVETIPYLALAVSAGICEEFIYRGFVMAALRRAGLGSWAIVVISAILFGLAHLYQGRGGLVSTTAIGLVFGTARIAYHSVVPVTFWHTAVDAVAGIAGPRYLLPAGNFGENEREAG